ncbi:hypothetical protein PRJ_2157 [Pseudomonas sp. XWY-1]|nr:hypothetical protein PRJ_2157 [Pseudomonas sp. XWY-1]
MWKGLSPEQDLPALSRVNPLLHRPPQNLTVVVACVGAGLPAKGPDLPHRWQIH